MKALIRKVHPRKYSRNGNTFIRVEFLLDNGEWVKTDLCPDFRNFSRWIPILKAGVGTEVDNLRFKKDGEVDGDSYPVITKQPDAESIAKLEKPKGVKVAAQQQTLLNFAGLAAGNQPRIGGESV